MRPLTISAADQAGVLTQQDVILKATEYAMQVLRGGEEGHVDQVMGAYKTAQSEILALITERFGDAEGQTLAQWQQSGRLRSLLQSIEGILVHMRDQVDGGIRSGSTTQFLSSYDHTVYGMDQATPDTTVLRYARPPENAVRILVETPYKGAIFSQRSGLITDAMASDLRDQLVQSLIQGEGIGDAAARVKGVIGISQKYSTKSYAYRAETIARSEIMRAQNLARDFAYEQNSDIVEGTEWLVSPDDKLCIWCARREGLTDAEIEAADTTIGKKTDPWGNSSEAPLHPNCRCTKIPKLASWKKLIGLDMPEALGNTARGMRTADGTWQIQPVEQFDKWLVGKLGGVETPSVED